MTEKPTSKVKGPVTDRSLQNLAEQWTGRDREDNDTVAGSLESIFGALQMFVARVDRDGAILESNQRFEPLQNFDPTALAPDEKAQVQSVLDRVFESCEALSCRFGRRGPDGTTWFEHRIGPVIEPGADRPISYATWVVLDVTAHVHLHDRATEVHRRRSLEKLAGGVAHDFNNLLTAIMGNTNTVIEDLPHDSALQEPLADVRKSAVRAAGLSRQLLAFSGKTGNELSPTGLDRVVEGLKSTLASTLPATTTVQWSLENRVPPVLADRAQIQHVVLQVVLNASEALDGVAGDVVVEIGREELDREMIAGFSLGGERMQPGDYVVVTVTDTGHGMDAETRRRMFDPFFTTRFVGRGMGLASSAGITRAHNGGIAVTSKKAEGSSVRLAFPVAHIADDIEPTPLPHGDGRGRRILVVDDEPVVLRFTKRALERFGFDVTCAGSGTEALQLYTRAPYDLVLLDMTMPEMSGEQTFTALRDLDPAVRTVLMSGYNALEATRRFTSEGLAGFLEKPFSARKLAAKVEEVLRRPVSSLH